MTWKGDPTMTEEKRTTLEEARRRGDEIGVEWAQRRRAGESS